MANDDTLTVCAVGDIGLVGKDPGSLFDLNRAILKEADITFGQLEQILSEREDAAHVSPLSNQPAVVAKALADAGFDLISLAGNHHMDAGVGAFVDTIDVLRQNNILPVGVGMNIAEARKPAIIERKGTKVAFLGYSSVIPRCEVPWEATQNRPGCAPMFVSTFYEPMDWQPGTPPKVVTYAKKEDLAAMREDIKRAKTQADVVVVSIHWGIHWIPAVIADYEYEVGHAAIDAGADLILGGHAHMLKGIEVYKGKVIFHCLGNFALEREVKGAIRSRWKSLSRFIPGDPSFDVEPGWERYGYPPDMRKTMIARFVIADKKIKQASFVPCLINQQVQAEPLRATDPRSDDVLRYMEWACKDQGMETKFTRDRDEIVVTV